MRTTVLALAVFWLAAPPLAAHDAPSKEYKAALRLLAKADSFELFSLDPDELARVEKGGFHGWRVLGQTTIKNKATRQRLIKALEKGVNDNDGSAAGCFNPRHGIRVKRGKTTADFVICYECLSMEVYIDGKKGGALTTRAPERVLNKVLKDRKVPLPKPAKTDLPARPAVTAIELKHLAPADAARIIEAVYKGRGDITVEPLPKLRCLAVRADVATTQQIREFLGQLDEAAGAGKGRALSVPAIDPKLVEEALRAIQGQPKRRDKK